MSEGAAEGRRKLIDRWWPLGLVTAAIVFFVWLADEVMEGETEALDRAVLKSLRNPADPADPLGPHWLETGFADLTALGSTTVLGLMTLVVVGYLLIRRSRAAALTVALSVIGGTVLSFGLKLVFERPRPDLVAHLVEVQTASFPSAHAMLSATTYLTLGALLARFEDRRRLKSYVLAVAIGLTFLVGISRIYLGVHWPTDVIAGWCAGAAWAVACARAVSLQQGNVKE
ncbi:phosphatase PAP2 family protein [Tistrella mobilis]|uniref:Phosphoesterase PA-phosphatase related protein n=1 Tax=Tistrella mobilis (strain KA081020-065) TaxID=1110502 RepID=I3TUR0_TISMK|nr:phosphatase PAP2 family protein [Tistrella mobilis]AFK56498.1 phosphoesterase PA-phosphatase related protein [Tistrella mobilis KA081020-065]